MLESSNARTARSLLVHHRTHPSVLLQKTHDHFLDPCPSGQQHLVIPDLNCSDFTEYLAHHLTMA